ncbi:MAG: hypothetical protein Q9191_006295 [Dirinaria sp. TL-2023a]
MQSATSSSNKENTPLSQPNDAGSSSGASPSSEASQANEASQHDEVAPDKSHENGDDPDQSAENSTREPLQTTVDLPERLTLPERPTLQRSSTHMGLLLQPLSNPSSSSSPEAADKPTRRDPQRYLKAARDRARQLLRCYPPSPPRMLPFLASLVQNPPVKGPRKEFGKKIREKPNWDHLLTTDPAEKQAQASPGKRKADGNWQMQQTRKRRNAISHSKVTRNPDPPQASPPSYSANEKEDDHHQQPSSLSALVQSSEPDLPLRIDEQRRPISPPPYTSRAAAAADRRSRSRSEPLTQPIVRLPPPDSYPLYDNPENRSRYYTVYSDSRTALGVAGVNMNEAVAAGRQQASARQARANNRRAGRRVRTAAAATLSVDAMVRNGAPVDEVDYVEDYDAGFYGSDEDWR